MNRRIALGSLLAAAGGLSAFAWHRRGRQPPVMPATVHPPLPAPERIGSIYHLGHSLVGPDMPAMLAQLGGHAYASQLGWGTTLKQHWTDGKDMPGFELRAGGISPVPARQALASGAFDVLVLTEMVEIRDAIRWHDSAAWLAAWARLARQGNPAIRVYLYETWHNLDDPAGWLERIETDLPEQWLGRVLAPAEAREGTGDIFLIPGGQAMAAVARAAEAGRLPGVSSRDDLFRRDESGALDTIHMGDLGAYVVALAHWAVIWQRSPVGLPHRLKRADGIDARWFDEDAAPRVQAIVRDVVAGMPHAGVPPDRLMDGGGAAG
ncbi:hypothetical protein GIY56_14560 [Paracoccus sp. YIM 132242]|uniref:SGNH/GDSL hydrolase family protein n=1 Tax=Paracoccus lichenicola TaxID=2665644 RepID=A0A6L6HW21_9RHOB|nr:hypothetical protein [Paracoccus lichenicola]MTE01508.1 hypothetical protein [Paracoccus lichenicola]